MVNGANALFYSFVSVLFFPCIGLELRKGFFTLQEGGGYRNLPLPSSLPVLFLELIFSLCRLYTRRGEKGTLLDSEEDVHSNFFLLLHILLIAPSPAF